MQGSEQETQNNLNIYDKENACKNVNLRRVRANIVAVEE